MGLDEDETLKAKSRWDEERSVDRNQMYDDRTQGFLKKKNQRMRATALRLQLREGDERRRLKLLNQKMTPYILAMLKKSTRISRRRKRYIMIV